jgi:dethiobiotin synthetase
VFAFKPVETGCIGEGPDQTILCDAAGGWQTGEQRGLYQLASPVAPLVAADAEGETIDLQHIRAAMLSGAERAEMTIVEGAGGWRVPFTSTADTSTLARLLELPVLIVARATLGTINHTLLTVEAVERDGLRVAGVALSLRPNEDREFALSNRDQIARRWNGRIALCTSTDHAELDVFLSS